MKNTMKLKSLLSFFVPAAILSLSVASCSDYDNGYTESAIKFAEEFRKAYGDIDPQQDWNLAERGTVTVSTLKESEVKIYALRGDEYVIVGDYEGVINTQILGFDMVEGTTKIMVSDGETAVETIPGGVVSFDGSTRTVNEGETYYGGVRVKIEKITNNTGLTLEENGVTYPKYKEATESDYDAMKTVIPEIGWRKNYTNLNKVTHDFSYVSNGTFIVYPYYWETSSNNTIGIYYNDANNNRQEVDLYTIKAGDEFQYKGTSEVIDTKTANLNEGTCTANAKYWQDSYLHEFVWWGGTSNLLTLGNMPNGNLLNSYTDVTIKLTFKKKTPGIRIVFRNTDGTDAWVDVNNPSPSENGNVENFTKTLHLESLDLNSWNGNAIVKKDPKTFLQSIQSVSLAGSMNVDNGLFSPEGGDISSVYGDVKLELFQFEKRNESWQNYSENFCSEIFTKGKGSMVRGQGIKVEIPKGTVFGMYLKKTDSSGSYTFYSQDDLNNPGVVGCGVTDNGNGTVTDVAGMNPCYASTFHVGEQMFLGFEDWPNVYHESDFDLNDVVFAFDGCKPTIINEDPTPGGTWLLVCEDLGGSFDTDYNDVIFKVEHISGKEYATVTAMAAGGTLASYIFFRDPTVSNAPDQCLGEIHQLFNVAPEVSGAYTPINVGYAGGTNRAEKNGNTVTIQVSKNWTMAYYQADQFHQGSEGNYGNEDTNMGGFQIRTLKSGTAAPSTEQIAEGGIFTTSATNSIIAAAGNVIPAPDKGAPPYILCLPYTYQVENSPVAGKRSTHVWSWPLELNTICSAVYDNSGKYHGSTGGAYSGFGAWVSDASKQENKYWYMNVTNDNMIVDPLILATEDMQQGGGGENGEKLPSPLTNKGPVTIVLGENVNLLDNLLNSPVDAYLISWSLSGSSDYVNVYSFSPASAGVYTLTASHAANDQYEAGSTTFTVKVQQPYTLSVIGQYNNTYYLGYGTDGETAGKLILTTSLNAEEKWVLEPSGVGEYFYMYNVGAKKYLKLDDTAGQYYAAQFINSPKGEQMARFMWLDGKIKRYESRDDMDDRFLGSSSLSEGSIVDGNADAPKGSTPIVWNQSAGAKRR